MSGYRIAQELLYLLCRLIVPVYNAAGGMNLQAFVGILCSDWLQATTPPLK